MRGPHVSTTVDAQIERLRTAVARFQEQFGRVPTVAFDADGVIYDFDNPYLAHHNRSNPNLPPVTGPFESFDVGYGQPEEVAQALEVSMQTLDWSELSPYPEALAVLPVLVEVGLDLSIATAHKVSNTYSPAAKVYQFHRDFGGYFDDRIQIGKDKTRVVADFLVDDKPEVVGALFPMWDHIRFTQHYNRDLPGVHVVWETMFEVLAAVIEAKVAGRTLTAMPATAADVPSGLEETGPQVLPDWANDEQDLVDPTGEDPGSELTTPLPWVEAGAGGSNGESPLSTTVPRTWDEIISGGEGQ